MFINTKSVHFIGVDCIAIDIQVVIAKGLPSFTIVGLVDRSVNEAKERIKAALSFAGIALPAKNITINLAPANITKSGSYFDLPIICALLAAMNIIPENKIDYYFIVGELSLDGSINSIPGVLAASIFANNNNCGIICPRQQYNEAFWSGNKDIVAVSNIIELIDLCRNDINLQIPKPSIKQHYHNNNGVKISDIKQQYDVKRAIEIAVAGRHNMLMIGPPGTGKTMFANSIMSLLPKPSAAELLESSIVYSVANKLPDHAILTSRPFRAPHHSASAAAIIGGGNPIRPGEISLAHNGVLFLDELPEFSSNTLEALRQPLEKKEISISRAAAQVTYPANIQLIAAMNPCKCGYYYDDKPCKRNINCAQEYQSKISGPLLDRIDIIIEVMPVDYVDLAKKQSEKDSIAECQRYNKSIGKALEIQQKRYKKFSNIQYNSVVDNNTLEQIHNANDNAMQFLNLAAEKLKLSARSYYKTIKIARTIADLAVSEVINKDHMAEAIAYQKRLLI